VGAVVLRKVPNTDASTTIAADDLALVGMNDYIVDSYTVTVRVAPLNRTVASLPDLDCAIFRACDQPFTLTMKCDTRNIACMAFEGEERIWIR